MKNAKGKAGGIAGALKRKVGPLPVWAWTLIAFVSIYYYRNRLGAQASGTGTGSVGPAPVTPQPQTVLQPGESVYDPNSGTLTTAPGGGDTGGQGPGSPDSPGNPGTDVGGAINNLAQSLEDAIAASTPAQPGQPDQTGTPGNPPSTKRKKRRLRPHKRKPKAKAGHHRGPGRHHRASPHRRHPSRPRSTTGIRGRIGGRGRRIAGHGWTGGTRGRRHHPTGQHGSGATHHRPHRRRVVGPPTVRSHPHGSNPPPRRHLTAQEVAYINAGTHPRRLTAQQVAYINAGMHGGSHRSGAGHRRSGGGRRRRHR